MHPGDMQAQIGLALDNLETVLETAGGRLRDVVRLNYWAGPSGRPAVARVGVRAPISAPAWDGRAEPDTPR